MLVLPVQRHDKMGFAAEMGCGLDMRGPTVRARRVRGCLDGPLVPHRAPRSQRQARDCLCCLCCPGVSAGPRQNQGRSVSFFHPTPCLPHHVCPRRVIGGSARAGLLFEQHSAGAYVGGLREAGKQCQVLAPSSPSLLMACVPNMAGKARHRAERVGLGRPQHRGIQEAQALPRGSPPCCRHCLACLRRPRLAPA